MNKLKIIFLLIGFILIIQYVVAINCNERIHVNPILGQAGNVLNEKVDKRVYKKYTKNLYSGSINIIEKYLTIYMILFIFSYYIRSMSIRR